MDRLTPQQSSRISQFLPVFPVPRIVGNDILLGKSVRLASVAPRAGLWATDMPSDESLATLLSAAYGRAIGPDDRPVGAIKAAARALLAGRRDAAEDALSAGRFDALDDVGADRLAKAFNPDEPRDERGRWTDGENKRTTEGGAGASDLSFPVSPSAPIPGLDVEGPRRPRFKGVYYLPSNAVNVTLPDGTFIANAKSPTGYLVAPPWADFRAVYAGGQAIASENAFENIAPIRAAIAQGGSFDFQRDAGTGESNSIYAAASNYSVGVFMAGAGYSLDESLIVAETYALHNSSNFLSKDRLEWIEAGWRDATAGRWK